MDLLQSYDSGHEFYRLTRLTEVFFFCFLIDFLFKLILQYWVDWKLEFIKKKLFAF